MSKRFAVMVFGIVYVALILGTVVVTTSDGQWTNPPTEGGFVPGPGQDTTLLLWEAISNRVVKPPSWPDGYTLASSDGGTNTVAVPGSTSAASQASLLLVGGAATNGQLVASNAASGLILVGAAATNGQVVASNTAAGLVLVGAAASNGQVVASNAAAGLVLVGAAASNGQVVASNAAAGVVLVGAVASNTASGLVLVGAVASNAAAGLASYVATDSTARAWAVAASNMASTANSLAVAAYPASNPSNFIGTTNILYSGDYPANPPVIFTLNPPDGGETIILNAGGDANYVGNSVAVKFAGAGSEDTNHQFYVMFDPVGGPDEYWLRVGQSGVSARAFAGDGANITGINGANVSNYPATLITISSAQSNFWRRTTAQPTNSGFSGSNGQIALTPKDSTSRWAVIHDGTNWYRWSVSTF